jgi:hypothetical protein
MPLGDGYFYNRETKKYIRIFEHATDAVSQPDVFKSHDVKHLNPVINRDEIVIHVLKQGFIRVRHWKERLGWQFWGDPKSSLSALKKYMKNYGMSDYCIVTFTDFESGKQSETIVKDVLSKNFIKKFTDN